MEIKSSLSSRAAQLDTEPRPSQQSRASAARDAHVMILGVGWQLQEGRDSPFRDISINQFESNSSNFKVFYFYLLVIKCLG